MRCVICLHASDAYLGGNAGIFKCWDLSPLLCNRTVTGHSSGMSLHARDSACRLSANQTQPSAVRTVWSFQTGTHPLPPGLSPAPTQAPAKEVKSTAALHPLRDIVYVSSWDFCVYALHSKTGAELWYHQMAGRSMSSPSIDPVRELVVVGSHDGFVHVLHAVSGAVKFKVPVFDRVLSSASLSLADGVAVIGSDNGQVIVIDLDTGHVTQRILCDDSITSVPVLVGSELYVTDFMGSVYRFDGIGLGAAQRRACPCALQRPDLTRPTNASAVIVVNALEDDEEDDEEEEDEEDEDEDDEEEEAPTQGSPSLPAAIASAAPPPSPDGPRPSA
jgi:WD40 repeat protein